MEILDRVSTYPGRVKLTPVSGQSNTYDMERADQPTQEGTPLNAAFFKGLASKPNLLDNWYFADPINQRGRTEYPGDGYGIDRWTNTGGVTVTVVDGGVTFTNTYDSGGSWPRQYFENALPAGTYTLSAKVKAATGSMYLYMGTTNGDALKGVTIADSGVFSCTYTSETDGEILGVWMTLRNGAAITLESIKLEMGSVSTLENDPPPNKALELAKCQRYFQRFRTSDLRPTYCEDFRPTMRETESGQPTFGGITFAQSTGETVNYYTASADL